MIPDHSDIPHLESHSIAVPHNVADRARRGGMKLDRIVKLREVIQGVTCGQKMEIYARKKGGGLDLDEAVIVTVEGDDDIGFILEQNEEVIEAQIIKSLKADYVLSYHDENVVTVAVDGTAGVPDIDLRTVGDDD